jgi:alpha-galactosidase
MLSLNPALQSALFSANCRASYFAFGIRQVANALRAFSISDQPEENMDHIRFDAGETTLILACAEGATLHVVHWGKRLADNVTAHEIVRMTSRQGGPGSADAPITASLAMEPGLGLLGPSGLSAHREGQDWGSLFTVTSAEQTATRATIICRDPRTRLRLDYAIAVDPKCGVITFGTALTNEGDAILDVSEMATACLPIPQPMADIIGFSGRWSNEFQRERLSRFSGGYLRENRRGRTSHDSFPAVILCTPTTSEASGEAYGLHLAWSGNHRVRVDSLNDGRVIASLGALLLPGEIRVAPGETYRSPDIVAGYSANGLSALSRHFHHHVRTNILRPSTRAKPRPVHYNSWEAVWFDHDVDQLKAIATRAANIGVERFVLDDGWFGARRHDQAGLGDWTVSDAVYPGGLKPLVDHVTSLGMEMGIWFEPEMVNPDSDLYRAHPDWALRIEGADQVPFRHQFVLDISRPEVSDYLFGQIDAILSGHAISYIKWDMNRDLNHPGDAAGRPRAHAQVEALYALIDRIRAAYPAVEIESCSSGGARPDMSILAHTDRIWTSDTNDAHDRQSIQRGASFFLPLDVLGTHIGPGRCHQTDRALSLSMRAGTALMGHMGLELNLLSEPAADLAELKAAIALHKQHRALIHNGDFHRIDAPDYLNIVGVVSVDQSEALYSVAFLRGHAHSLPDRLYVAGLDPAAQYQVRLVWPQEWRSQSSPSIVEALDLIGEGALVSGDALLHVGLQLPLTVPETVLLFHFERGG